MDMRFELLGPVRGWRGDTELDLGSPQQRLTLAALLLAEGRMLSVQQLVDVLWADAAPRTAANTVRNYVSRLRGVLGQAAVRSMRSGYSCTAALDVREFAALVSGARNAPPAEARDLLERALRLWRGEPLSGLPGAWAQAQRSRLVEMRLSAFEARAECDLALGRHQESVAELTSLVSRHPARERLCRLLMLALYRSGRQAEAIGLFADTRRSLAEAFGVDPSPDLARLYQQIITGDPALNAEETAAEPAAVTLPVPRQLPLDVADFTGRAAEVEKMVGSLRSGGARTLLIWAVSGQGGVGKTTLALRVAHAVKDLFPDGQLFVDLQGAGPDPMPPATALGVLMRSLGQGDLPDGLAERAALYRSLLADRRVLVVLDNARDVAQLTPLLPGSAGCAVLATSRAKPSSLDGALQMGLDVLSADESIRLLAAILGQERVAAEPDSALELVTACGFLPLAIRIAAARLATRPTWTLAQLTARLADERRRLARLRVGDLAVEVSFSLSYEQLRPELARAFRLLAVPDAAELTAAMAARLLDLAESEAEELGEELVDLSLLQSPAIGRYRQHDLLKCFARARLEEEEGDGATRAALLRLHRYFEAGMAGALRLGSPGNPLADRLEQQAGEAIGFEDLSDVGGWLDDTSDSLLSCVSQVIELPGSDLYELARLMNALGELRTLGRPYVERLRRLLAAATGRGDRAAEGYVHLMLGLEHMDGSRSPLGLDADEHGRLAVELAGAVGDLGVQAYAWALLGYQAGFRHDNAAAAECFERGMTLAGAAGERRLEAAMLARMGTTWSAMGRTEAALAAARRAFDLQIEIGDGKVEPITPYILGFVLARAGEHEEALEHLEAALGLATALGYLFWTATAQIAIARVRTGLGRPEEALTYAEAGLAGLATYPNERGMAEALTEIGRALSALGRHGRARAALTSAVEIFERLGVADAYDTGRLLDALPARG
ncbi:BTAD domain-containing putative transcriptional regulator [Nonomuraea pusilla]|uniref:AfsR/SARP family transcriptional regulator n=1 Tax=Nonomuraea pusilla TaxID=46177 RepID=UPI00332AB0BA